jgi:hypothetical protein
MKAARNAQKDDANENLNMDNNDPAPGGLTPSA